MFAEIFALVFPLFALIGLGVLAGKIFEDARDGTHWINIYLIYVALPALFYKILSETKFEELSNWSYVVVTTSVTFGIFVLGLLVTWIIGRKRFDAAVLGGAMTGYGNIGYMGVPMVLAAFGAKGGAPAALILCFDNLLFFVLVPLLVTLVRPGNSLLTTFRKIFLTVAFHPFIVASAIGILASLYQVNLPSSVDQVITMLYGSAAPLALFAIGVTLANRREVEEAVIKTDAVEGLEGKKASVALDQSERELPILVAIKLVLHPLAVLTALTIAGGFSILWIGVAVIQAALPTATNVFILASQYQTYKHAVSRGIFLSTLTSLVTLTGVLYLIKSGKLEGWGNWLALSIRPLFEAIPQIF